MNATGPGLEHERAVRQERVISTAINSLVPAGIIWAVEARPPIRLVGPDAILAAMVPASGLATFVMTLILTLIVRGRVNKGSLPSLHWPRPERGVLRFVPQNLVLRAVVLALTAIVLLVPAGLVVVAVSATLPFTEVEFLIFNLIFGAVVGLVMTRFVVLPALADGPQP